MTRSPGRPWEFPRAKAARSARLVGCDTRFRMRVWIVRRWRFRLSGHYRRLSPASIHLSFPSGKSFSNGVDAIGRTGDYIEKNSWAQAAIRQDLKRRGYKFSMKAVSKDAGLVGKFAGGAAKVLALKSAYERYQKCRAF